MEKKKTWIISAVEFIGELLALLIYSVYFYFRDKRIVNLVKNGYTIGELSQKYKCSWQEILDVLKEDYERRILK